MLIKPTVQNPFYENEAFIISMVSLVLFVLSTIATIKMDVSNKSLYSSKKPPIPYSLPAALIFLFIFAVSLSVYFILPSKVVPSDYVLLLDGCKVENEIKHLLVGELKDIENVLGDKYSGRFRIDNDNNVIVLKGPLNNEQIKEVVNDITGKISNDTFVVVSNKIEKLSEEPARCNPEFIYIYFVVQPARGPNKLFTVSRKTDSHIKYTTLGCYQTYISQTYWEDNKVTIKKLIDECPTVN
jgi:hypothetical protein